MLWPCPVPGVAISVGSVLLENENWAEVWVSSPSGVFMLRGRLLVCAVRSEMLPCLNTLGIFFVIDKILFPNCVYFSTGLLMYSVLFQWSELA